MLAEKHRDSKDVCFIRGDLQALPFAKDFFDMIVANGVIHHTPSTEVTFNAMAPYVKEKGKFYLRPKKHFFRKIHYFTYMCRKSTFHHQ